MIECWYKNVCNLAKDCNPNSCPRYLEMLTMLELSGIPESRWIPASLEAGKDLKVFQRLAEIKQDIVNWVTASEQNLYIGSKETGNGKTSWAIKLMLKYFDNVWAGNGFKCRGLFVHTPTLLLQLKNFNAPLDEAYKSNLLNVDLIIWDDIASTDLTNYDLGQLLMYIDSRIMAGRSNIFTGNFIEQYELVSILGDRLASRIWNTSEIIIFKGKDRRGI